MNKTDRFVSKSPTELGAERSRMIAARKARSHDPRFMVLAEREALARLVEIFDYTAAHPNSPSCRQRAGSHTCDLGIMASETNDNGFCRFHDNELIFSATGYTRSEIRKGTPLEATIRADLKTLSA